MADVPDPTSLENDTTDLSPFGRANERKLGGYVGRAAVNLAAMPTGLYSLASDALKSATSATVQQDDDSPLVSAGRAALSYFTPAYALRKAGITELPGAEGARDITETINKTADEFGNRLAGQGNELQPGLLKNNPVVDKIGTALDIAGSLIPVTGGPLKTGFEALKDINTGIKLIDKTVPAAAEVASFLTPFIPTDSPKALIAVGTGIGALAQTADDVFNDMHVKAADSAAKAVDGVGQAFDSTNQLDISHEIENFNAGLPPTKPHVVMAGTDLGDYGPAAAAVAAISVAAGVAFTHRNVVKGSLLEPFFDKATQLFGGSKFGSDAARDFITRPDATAMDVGQVAKAQGVNWTVPLTNQARDPELMMGQAEKIASAWERHSQLLLNEGKFAESRITLNQPASEYVDLMKNVIGPDSVKFKLFNDTANAIADTRQYENWLSSGKDAADYTFHVPGATYGDLKNTVKQGMADPDVAQAIKMHSDITKKTMAFREEQGQITKRELADFNKKNPYYFPARVDGRFSPMPAVTGEAGRNVATDSTKEIFPYVEQMVRETAEGKLHTSWITEMKERADQGDAYAKSVIGRDIRAGGNERTSDKMVPYRDVNANKRLIEITDPLMRDALRHGAGTAAIRLNKGFVRFLGAPSRVLETLTTHPLTALVGSPFAVGNMMYGSMATMINRQAGMSTGWIDKFIQDTGLLGANKQGVNRGFRGDPTFYAQVIASAGQNFVARLAQYGGKALETVPHNSWLAGAMGRGTLDTMGKAMSNHYKASMLAEMHAQGLHGGATAMGRAQIYTMKDLENVAHPINRASEAFKATSNFAWDLFRAIGDAPQAAFYKQNKGRVSQELLTTRARNVMGDPSKAGLATSQFGKTFTEGTIIHPWGSVTLQSFAKLLESAHTNPFGTAAAIVSTVAIPSILTTLWNMRQGKEYVDYQHNRRTPDQVAGSLYFAIPGAPPEQGLEWRVDQPMRPFKVLTDNLFGHLYGLHDGSIFKPENDDLRKALADSVSTRYGPWGDAMRSAAGQVLPAVPTWVNLGLGAFGKEQFRSYTEAASAISDKNKNAGASDSTSRIIDNKWFGVPVSANLEATLSNTAGQVGQAIYEMLTAHYQGSRDGLSGADQRSDFLDRFGMRLGQSSREVSGVWGHAATLSPSQEASAKTIQEQMSGMRKLDAASTKLRSMNGSGDLLTGGKGQEIEALIGPGPVRFADQQMYNLAFDAQKFVQMYDGIISRNIKNLYEQRASIQSSEKVAPDVKRTLLNDNAQQIVAINRKGLSALEQWKWSVSKVYNRDIDLKNIQLDQPITQFKPLLASPTNPSR